MDIRGGVGDLSVSLEPDAVAGEISATRVLLVDGVGGELVASGVASWWWNE